MTPAPRGQTVLARRLGMVSTALLAIALILSCDRTRPPSMARNDCQQGAALVRLSSHDSVLVGGLQLIGPIADEPEYHDCQRFVLPRRAAGAASRPAKDGMVFGPLVAIWAANKLDSAFAKAPRGPSAAVPVALIYNFDRHPYEPLELRPGFSCLYLVKDSTWVARMRWIGTGRPAPDSCADTVATTSREWRSWPALPVWSDAPITSFRPEDIPPVARWNWDPKRTVQYIGIRCGDAWCSVMPAGMTKPIAWTEAMPTEDKFLAALEPISGIADPIGLPRRARALLVAGWNDQQRLDLRDEATHDLILSDVVGYAFPHPDLDAVKEQMFDSTWIPVSYVWVTGRYMGKLPLEAGLNRIYLCRGSKSVCRVDDAALACQTPGPDGPDSWWQMRVGPSGAPAFHCVTRRTHGGMPIPVAAARWHWSEVDATTWSRCGNACCTGN